MSSTPQERRPVQARRISEVSPAQRRRALARALAAMVATAAAIFTIYYLVPLSADELQVRLLPRFLVAGVVFLAVLAWQVRQILRSELPVVRAAQAVVVAIPLFLAGYALLYLLGSRGGADFSQELTRTSALYFTVVVFSSVGFGDITPTSDTSRVLVMTQMLGGILFLGVAIRIFFAASRLGLQLDRAGPPSDDEATDDA